MICTYIKLHTMKTASKKRVENKGNEEETYLKMCKTKNDSQIFLSLVQAYLINSRWYKQSQRPWKKTGIPQFFKTNCDSKIILHKICCCGSSYVDKSIAHSTSSLGTNVKQIVNSCSLWFIGDWVMSVHSHIVIREIPGMLINFVHLLDVNFL